jgi:hypothetical protein
MTTNSTNDDRTPKDPSKVHASDPEFALAYVHYLGFQAIAGGRRLKFDVKSRGQTAIEVTCDIPDEIFSGAFGVRIQDAAPMAYEALVELLTREHTFEATSLFLTREDIATYRNRHRKGERSERTKRTETAA